MEKIKRRVILDKYLVPIDTNNDGLKDTLAFTSTTINMIVHLTQNIDDMGIFTDVDGEISGGEGEPEDDISTDSVSGGPVPIDVNGGVGNTTGWINSDTDGN